MSSRLPMYIPLRERVGREDAHATSPWFTRADGQVEPGGSPWLATFDSTKFVDAFFDGVRASSDGWTANAWPGLVPYRDFAEPPGRLLDASGGPLYPTQIDAQGDLEPADRVSNPQQPDIPEPEVSQRPAPAWLRKLYLPPHEHFHLVAFELVCRRPYLPPLASDRIVETGMVVRRLQPDAQAYRWEDWVPGPDGGVWRDIADADMQTPLSEPVDDREPIDPCDLSRLGDRTRAELRADLGLGSSDPTLTLAPKPLAALPQKYACTDRGHRVFYGYLPLVSGEVERHETAGPDAVDAAVDSLKKRSFRQISTAVYPHVDRIGEDIATAWEQLAMEVLPAPSGDAYSDRLDRAATEVALEGLRRRDRYDPWQPGWSERREEAHERAAFSWMSQQQREQLLDTARNDVEAFLEACLDPFIAFLYSLADTTDTSTWWTSAARDALDQTSVPVESFREAIEENKALFVDLIALALRRYVERSQQLASNFVRVFSNSPPRTGTWLRKAGISTVVLRRLRSFRIELLRDVYAFFDSHPELGVDGRALVDQLDDDARDDATVSAGSLAGEISAWIAREQQRDDRPTGWPLIPCLEPSGSHQKHHRVHAASVRLERRLDEFEEQAGVWGRAYDTVMSKLANQATAALSGWDPAGVDDLDGHGLDTSRQPERGTLVFPGLGVTESWSREVLGDVPSGGDLPEGRIPAYFDAASSNHSSLEVRMRREQIEGDLQGKRHAVRSRYDAQSVYAIWCYARVAGETECDREQVVWTRRSELFSIAEPTDILGVKPMPFELPDLQRLVRDIPRIGKAEANPFASISLPKDSAVSVGDDPKDTRRQFGIAWIKLYAIPVFTIVAWILFRIIFAILIAIPGFAWMLLLKIWIPIGRDD